MNKIKSINKIETILGASDKRYFSNGFRNIEFEYTNLTISKKSISCKLLFNIKNTWSKKAQIVKPHLGTVEYFAVSVFMSEILLKTIEGLSDTEISSAWVTDFYIKTRPNNNLEAEHINVNAIIISSSELNHSEWDCKKIINIEIGTINVTLVTNHNRSKNANSSLYYNYASILDNYKRNLYTNGYKCSYHNVTDIKLNSLDQEATSKIILKQDYSDINFNGLGSKYLNVNLITDHILATGQLIQVLLYEMDNIKRDESNNLWLRELTLNYPIPFTKTISSNHIKSTESRIIAMKNENWRLTAIEVTHENIKSIFKVSHKLPY